MFVAGSKVVCVDDSSHTHLINKGSVYTVEAVTTCSCGLVKVDVGVSRGFGILCSTCLGPIRPEGRRWFRAERFRMLEELSETTLEEVLQKIKSYRCVGQPG